jgi:hypothetical protein
MKQSYYAQRHSHVVVILRTTSHVPVTYYAQRYISQLHITPNVTFSIYILRTTLHIPVTLRTTLHVPVIYYAQRYMSQLQLRVSSYQCRRAVPSIQGHTRSRSGSRRPRSRHSHTGYSRTRQCLQPRGDTGNGRGDTGNGRGDTGNGRGDTGNGRGEINESLGVGQRTTIGIQRCKIGFNSKVPEGLSFLNTNTCTYNTYNLNTCTYNTYNLNTCT